MRKKFTMLFAALFLVMGTAWAYQFSYDKTTWTVPATNHEKVTTVPEEVFTVYNTNYSDAAALEANKVGVYAEEVTVTASTVTVTLAYTSGNGSNIRLDICGIDLVDAEGSVKYKDYHFGYTGGNSSNNTYTLSDVVEGSYTLRVFVPSQKEDFTNASNNSRGNMTVTGATRPIVGSTAENKIFYHIKNVRSNKYANYEGANVQFTQIATPTLGSYWYLMEVADAQNVPDGYKAYRLYNAANALAVENPSNGYMSANEGVQWPAKVYCIGEHTKGGHTGVVIRALGEDGASWNDAGGNGKVIANHSYDDPGSIWEFEKVNVTEAQLIQNAVAAKTAVVNTLTTEATNTQRYYYGYELSAIEEKKAEIEAISVSQTSLVDALTSAITISKMTPFAGLERIAPKAGDKFTMVNRGRNSGKDGLVAFAAGTAVKCLQSPFPYFDAVWTLVATGTEGQFKLYNEKMNVYVGVLADANDTRFEYVSEAENAGVYELANVEGYATFKKVGGDNYSHLHQSGWGGKEIVRWDNGDCSQWQLAKAFGPELTTDADNPICYALKSGRGDYHFTLESNKVKLYQNKPIATDETTHWYFMPDGNGNLKMYSKSDNKAMGYVKGTDGNTKLTNDPATTDYDSNTYTLYFAPYNQTNYNGAWFALKPSRGDTYVSNHGGASNYMGFYNEFNDAGTRIAFVNVDRMRLEAKVAECEAKVVGDAIGYYSVSGGDAAVVLAEAKAALQGNSNEAYRNSLTALNALTYTLNMPETGKYYRISYNFGDAGVKYVQAKASNVPNKLNAMVMTDEKDEASIFYYDEGATLDAGDNKLLSYSTGQYVDENDRGLQPVGAQGGNASFEAGSSIGLLKIKVPNYFHANISGDIYFVDHCSGGEHAQHNFTVEEVDMSFVRVEFNELVYSARGYAMWMEYGNYTHLVYDYATLCAEIERIDLSIGDDAKIAEIQAAIQEIEAIIAGFDIKEITPGFYYFVNSGEYLSDDRKSDEYTQRLLTKEDPSAKNIFYYDGQALMSYASGFGFEFGICNTRTPEKMNHFEFGMAYEPGKYTVKSTNGTSLVGWADNQYWTNNNGELGKTGNAADASGWDIQAVASLPVTVGPKLHATFFAPVAVTIPNGIQAYTGEVKGEWLTLTEVEGTIPAGTPVVLIAQEAKTYEFAIVESEDDAISSHLRGTAPTIVNDKKDAADKYYTLQSQPHGDGVAFRPYIGANIGGFKAYLEIPAGTNAAALRIRFAGDEEGTTGIESVELGEELVIFDLAGRRVQKMEKGIYIVNGKKVVIK